MFNTKVINSLIFCMTIYINILPCRTEYKFTHGIHTPLRKTVNRNTVFDVRLNEPRQTEKTLDPTRVNVDQQPQHVSRDQREDRKEDDWTDYPEKAERSPSDIESALHRIQETVSSNEKYLHKIDIIETKTRKIDFEVHGINEALTKTFLEMNKQFQMQNWQEKNIVNELKRVRAEITQVKLVLGQVKPSNMDAESDASVYHSKCETKLSNVEYILKLLTDSVEQILTTMLEVKNRSTLRSNRKSESPVIVQDTLSNLVHEFKRALQEKTKRCDCSKMGRSGENFPTDCSEIQSLGFNVTGIYKIKPEDFEPFYVLCDMNTAGGGWTVFQNRYDGSQDFFRTWSEYKYGFGNLAGEFWLGLEKLHYLTNQKLYELRIEIESQSQEEVYATYTVFSIGSEIEGYRISTIGSYHGSAGDSLTYHSGQKFSTFDADNDDWKDGICAIEHGGAWWYKECDKSNLNGRYVVKADDISKAQGIYWNTFKGPTNYLTKTRMMIKPLPVTHTVAAPTYTYSEAKSVSPSVFNKYEDLTRKTSNAANENTIPFIPLDEPFDQPAPRKWSPSYEDNEKNELRFIRRGVEDNISSIMEPRQAL